MVEAVTGMGTTDREQLSAIGRMAAGIAHDLNNSRAPVVGLSELLLLEAEHLTSRHRGGPALGLGRLAAGSAQDLNNSPAPVVGFSELLLLDAEHLTDRQREWLRLVHIGALDASRTVARLREAYRQRTPGDDCETIDLAR